jgi:5-formyltetrahydrofolate cyclo-ligase
MDKITLRTHCRQIRDQLSSEQIAVASAQICAHIAAWSVFAQARTVMAYLAFRNEIDLGQLLRECSNKQWVVPRTIGKPEPHLVLHSYAPARLVRHKFGMLEPDPACPVIDPGSLDLILVPGLAFDRRGFRLGLGGGFYDRFLPQVSAPTVGIVCSALIVETVPVEPHDQPVNYLACEDGVLPMNGWPRQWAGGYLCR